MKYNKFKKCSLPISITNDDTAIWLFNNGEVISQRNEIYEAFSEIIKENLTYHIEVVLKDYDEEKNVLKSESKIICCHNFNTVIESLYTYPESFNIPSKYLEDYAKAEILFLNKLQGYLKLIGLKDYTDSQEIMAYKKEHLNRKKNKKYYKILDDLEAKQIFKRVNNKKVYKYQDVDYFKASDKMLEAILKGEKQTRIFRKYGYLNSVKGNKYFVLDKDNNYRALIEIEKEEIMPFKDLKVSLKDYKIGGYKSLKEYKESLYTYFNDNNNEEEVFNEDSLIIVAYFKVKEKYPN